MANFTSVAKILLFSSSLLVSASAFSFSAADSTKTKSKDSQNQTEFMKPDMDAKEYNFYDRKAISTPLMPSYDEDSAAFQKGKKKELQQKAYKDSKYRFPAKPKDQWELGINFGLSFISGDVSPRLSRPWQNIGAGLTVRKALGYVFSLRFQYQFGLMTGLNFEPDYNLRFNQALNGRYDKRTNYYDGVYKTVSGGITTTTDSIPKANRGYFFYNYRTITHEATLQGVINLGNIRFHKERNLVNIYAVVGAGGIFSRTTIDALDANGKMYDFTEALGVYNLGSSASGTPPVNSNLNRRKETMKVLNKLFDGKYESNADRETNVTGFKNYQLLPVFTIGAGIGFHVSKWVTLSIEEKLSIVNSDVLDGYRWTQDEYSGFTRDNDNISYTSVSVNIHLGKKRTEPMFWLNPIDHTYKKLAEVNPDKIIAEAFKDDDEDGVPNKLDKEPASKKGCPVDVKGVMLDSDKDGILDCDDKEPYSPPGYPVDQFGVAQIPPNPCCDNAEDGDLMIFGDGADGTGVGADGDSTGANGGKNGLNAGKKRKRGGSGDCSKIELPGVYFDADKYYIDPSYLGSLHQVAERMQNCPDMKLVMTGYDESKNDQKYNEQLGWNRAQKVADYLVEKYGISRDRFIVKYEGGKKSNAGKSELERKQSRKVEFRYANEGEQGESNPPSPHPGYKAGSDK
jgi:OOP family OmpA-OmpF porin